MPELRRWGIGVIGLGGMGARHAANLARYGGAARVVALYDPDGGRARASAAGCPEARIFAEPAALIADGAVDAVVVASPDATHVAAVLACLEVGKPVLCEKPLALTLAEAERVIAAETAIGRRLVALGFMRRFDPQHVAVQQLLGSGAIGRPILYKGVHRNAESPLDLANDPIILNSASHDLDAARWLLGKEIVEVFVRGVRTRSGFSAETRDLLLLQLTLADECLATVEVFVAADYGYEVSAEIVGQFGSAVTGQPEPALLRARRSRAAAVPIDWLERFQEAYVAEISAWLAALSAGSPWPGASAWDGYAALLAGDACRESLRTRQPVAVPQPERPALYS